MSLRSQLFSGDAALESAAVSDPAHITPGARGEHVRKIQLALNQLDHASLTPDGAYGSGTAAAVLAYKRSRNIVNRSYQIQPDNIVGKMTITALDLELVAQEARPVIIRALHPPAAPHPPRAPAVTVGFALADGGVSGGTVPRNQAVGRAPAPIVGEVVISPGGVGSLMTMGARGGTLVRWQEGNLIAVAHLQEAKVPGAGSEHADVVSDTQTFIYRGAADICGQTWFQWFGPEPTNRRSGILTVFVLVRKSTYAQKPVARADDRFKTGLLSTEGTPLNPLPGRRINIFGRGESNGFEDYSSDIKYCADSKTETNPDGTAVPGTAFKPWTNDPRKPEVGLAPKSVQNICCRNSPVHQVTIDEIERVASPGCRVTFAGDRGFAETLRRKFVDAGGATLRDEGPCGGGFGGFAIIFELR